MKVPIVCSLLALTAIACASPAWPYTSNNYNSLPTGRSYYNKARAVLKNLSTSQQVEEEPDDEDDEDDEDDDITDFQAVFDVLAKVDK